MNCRVAQPPASGRSLEPGPRSPSTRGRVGADDGTHWPPDPDALAANLRRLPQKAPQTTPALARRRGDAPTRSGEVALCHAPRLRSCQIRRSDADRGGRQSPWTTRPPRRLPWPDRAPRPLAARATRAPLAEGSRPRGPAPNRTLPPRDLPSATALRSA